MQLYYVVLLAVLVAVTMLSSVDGLGAEATAIKPVVLNMGHSLDTDKSNTIPRRFLRGENATGQDHEERMFDFMRSLLQKLKRFFQSKENAELQSWLKTGMSTDNTFKILQLDEAGDKLLSNPNLKRWAVFVAKKTGKSPEQTMITKLRTQYDDANLAVMLQAGKKKWGTKNMATKLQNAQFKQWYEEGMRPHHVVHDVFKLDVGRWLRTPARPVWAAYKKFLQKNNLELYN
ncbi:Avirulence (Avh) protein [Phytophthora megakarya]|uniref:RxLR effector protein n=1 Tax=Phytophthora megakarya TaxID=4795 RepID=A0A225VEL8_9STRA|nr:Avirulence (Avh) protein [Phytophthora megakarya]